MLFAGIIVASVGVFSYATGRAALRESAAVNVSSIALEKEAALEIWREERLEDVASIASLPSMIDHTEALIGAPLDSTVAHVARENLVQDIQPFVGHHFFDLLVIEPELGMVIASTGRGEQGKFKENRPYFLNGKNGPYAQNPYYSYQFQGLAITFSAPILSRDGILLGVRAVFSVKEVRTVLFKLSLLSAARGSNDHSELGLDYEQIEEVVPHKRLDVLHKILASDMGYGGIQGGSNQGLRVVNHAGQAGRRC